MGQLSDEKLAKLNALDSQGGFWYITKQNLVFRDLCFMAKILEVWNDRKDENYQVFFDSHKELPEYGSLSSLTAHRATKNCEYIGLTVPSEKYSTQNLTPFYFELKKICEGDFNQLSSYPQIIDKQLERMFIDSHTNKTYTSNFQICPFMFLFKVLLMIGDITKLYKISTVEFKLFVATAQTWNEYFEVVESIFRYRNDKNFQIQCNKNNTKVSDVRYNVLAQNHSQLTVTNSEIAILENEVKNVRRKIAEYELNEKVQSTKDIYTAFFGINKTIQQIYYGAPGTGKSHTINEITELQPKENVFRTTFHPDSDYSTFVGCYKPTMTAKPVRNVAGDVVKKDGKEVIEKSITYSFIPQSFTKAYLRAWQTDEPVYLVIEEINRGNCAQIFGDLFQLLDRKCDGFSEYPIKADNDLATYIAEKLSDTPRIDIPELVKNGEELMLPSNLYIWATMNTSDQSLFPIDSAFKRRWDWKYIPIDTKKESWNITADGINYSWSDFLEKINAKIEAATSSEDKMLGFYFCKAENGTLTAERFVNKVLFYLWNDVFKDYGFDDAIFNGENNEKLTFRKFYTADGKVDECKVKRFLDNLEVENDKTLEPEAQE